MENANLLLNIGNFMYKKSKNFIFFAPVGIVCLLITMLFCGEYAQLYLVFSGAYAFVNFLVFGFYVMIAIGFCAVWPYFMGLILIGIGQIALNTSDATVPQANNSDVSSTTERSSASSATECSTASSVTAYRAETPATPCQPRPAVNTPKPSKWVCDKCQTENSTNYSQCKKCGNFRSNSVQTARELTEKEKLDGYWFCEKCYTKNLNSRDTCWGCDSAR